MMRRSGIKQQTFLVALIPIIVMTTLLSGYFVYSRFNHLDQDMLERSQSVARQLAFTSEYAIFSGNMELLQQNVESTLSQPNMKSVLVLDADDRRLAVAGGEGSDYAALAAKVNSANPAYQDKNRLLLYLPVEAAQIRLDDLAYEKGKAPALVRPLGAVILEISKASLNNQKNELLLYTALAALLVLAVSLTVALWVARRITGPVLGMEAALRLIGEGELGTRISEQFDVHELNELAIGINRMAQQLQEDRGMLESRVLEATRELRNKKEEAEQAATEKARLYETLVSTLNELNTIIEANPDILYVFDAESRLTKWNSSFARFCGLAPEQMRNKPALEFICEEDRSAAAKAVGEIFEKGFCYAETRLIRHDGAPVLFLCNGVVLRDQNGKVLGFTGTGRDITERRRVEEELRESEKRYRTLYSNTPVMLHSIDKDGVIVNVSNYWLSCMGYARDEVIGRKSIEFLTDASRRYAVEEVLPAFMKSGVCSDVYYQFVRKDGSIMDVLLSAIAERDDAGSILHSLAVVVDITERKKAQDALQAAKIQAEEASRSKGHFLSNMSHEIRTPMNSILGMAQLALKNENDPKQRDYLKKIHLSGEHLLGVIDDILDFSKIDANKLSLENIDFDLEQIRQTLSNLVEWKAAEKGLKLAFDFDPSIPRNLRGDPLRMNQILINYINNAIKFTRQGEVIVRARMQEEREKSILLRFEVQDTGIGITDEQKARLFHAFQQADPSISRNYGGSGLGLVISQRLAQLMDGEVGVESEAGKGSTFWVVVRIGKGSAALPMQAGMHTGRGEAVLANMAALNGARILLAEDSLFNQQVAAEFLKDAGAIVYIANNGEEALDLIRHESFDCVLMDVQMPMMDGLEATRLLRADAAFALIPVVALTANASNEDRERCLAAGMNDFIGKPFKINEFYATIARWLSVRPQPEPARVTHAPPATKTPGGNADIIDLAVLADMMGNDHENMRRFAFKFIDSAEKDISQIEEALERNDIAAVGDLGHRAKSGAYMVGAMGFAKLCQALENNRDSAGVEQMRGTVSKLRPLLERIKEQINNNLM